MNRDQPDRRNEYLDERKLLIDAEREQSRSFDKAMLTLSAGALALSLTYMADFVVSPSGQGLLYAAWILFSISLLATAWSFLISQSALRKQREILDAIHGDKRRADRHSKNTLGRVTNCLNLCSVIAFTVAVAMLAAFAILNFQNKA